MTTAVDSRIPTDGVDAARARVPKAGPRRRLFTKYAAALVGLVTLVLLINGSLDVWFSYDEAKDAAIQLQREKAEAAAQRIEAFIAEIERQIGWTTATQWASAPIDSRRFDFGRLLRQVPAITELSQLDDHGREQLKVSRLSMDVVGSNADFSADPRFTEALKKKVWFGPVYFRKESEPYMTMAVAQSGRNAGVTVAEVNLKLIWDVITAIKIGKTGYAYVVDDKGRLIAHPDISRVLRNTDMSALPQVIAARGASAGAAEPAEIVRNLDGHRVLSASAAIPRLGWLVFVEQPIGEALAPLYTSVLDTGLLLVIGLFVAVLAGLLLARRMTGPIRVLDAGAARIGAGALDHRISVRTGDELEELAERFNTMAADLQSSYADLERKVEDRTAELKEALDQQTATAEVLQVINSSPGDLTPVFDTMLERAMHLCEAAFGMLWTYDGERLHAVAMCGVPGAFAEFAREPVRPGSETGLGRILRGERLVHIADLKAGEAYRSGDRVRIATVELAGARTLLLVPLRKDDALLGIFSVYRQEVRSFSEKQIALMQNFAAQAVIAMENARLLGELRARTRDLEESLEYQTATSDVLKVISRSTFDLQPVLDTVLATAARLCNADIAGLARRDGEVYRMGASYALPPDYDAFVRSHAFLPGRDTVTGRTALERRVVHIADIAADPDYALPDSTSVGKIRTALGVPLLREGEPIGVVWLARQRVEPFSERQIELVSTFADQAVIAIENARLLNELRARTAELGQSVEELKMLSEVGQAVSSTLDLRSVLSAILTASLGVTWANAGAIFSYSRADRSFRLVEAVGWGEALTRSVRDLRIGESETALSEAMARRMPIQLAELAQRASYPLRDAALAAGFHSVLIVPLVGAERIFGAITLMRQEPGEFPAETVRLMQTLASQSVLAIQNARLFREIAEKSEELALASQHKSQFLANMSHELRTPLNAILGYAELLVDGIYGPLPDRPKGVLERIQNNGKHLLALINDVLDLAKIEAGQLNLTLENYSLPEVVRSVVTATEPLATAKGLKFSAAVQDNLPTAHGDARRVSQILLNLVGNAIKFTDQGEVEIRAAALKGQFVLTVRDTGPGIADADQDLIFGEFQQIDNSNTRKKGGTGLGLAISKRMIEMQGGTISVESALGQGSTFRVVLPVHVDELMEAAE
jgi:signal transduction histidine kinase/putative methionine-R-sulfoxide reductase with GAF domain